MKIDRIKAAWERCQGFILEPEEAFTETYFLEIPIAKVVSTLEVIRSSSQSFSGSWDELENGNEISIDDIETIHKVESGNLVVHGAFEFVTQEPGFDFQILILIDANKFGSYDVDIVWHSKDVFTQNIDNFLRFQQLLKYFISQQVLFTNEHLFIGPENPFHPLDRASKWASLWVEI